MALAPSEFANGVTPQVAQVAQPVASAGAEIAQGAGQLGDTIFGAAEHHAAVQQQVLELQRQQEINQQTTDATVKFAQLRADMAAKVTDLRQNAAPGGDGHLQAVAQAYNPAVDQLMDGITNPIVRQHMVGKLAGYGAELSVNEGKWQSGEAAKKQATDGDQAKDTITNNVMSMTDAKTILAEAGRWPAMVSVMTGNADFKAKLTRSGQAEIIQGAISAAAIRGDTALANELLATDVATNSLDPRQKEVLSREIVAADRRVAAQARATDAHQRSVTRDQLETVGKQLDAGAGTYADRIKLADQYRALGDNSQAEAWGGKAQEWAATQESKGWTLPQMDQRITALAAKQSGGGLSAGEAHELNGLKAQRDASNARLSQPGGALLQYQYASGQAVTPLDFHNPASVATRGASARSAAGSYGRPQVQPLLDTDLTPLREAMAQGTNGRMQVLDQLRQFGDPKTIAGAAQQLAAKDDGQFRIAAQLDPSVARDVLRGDDTLKDHREVWNDKQAEHDFAAWYGPTLSALGGNYRDDVYQAAKSFYAQRASDGRETKYNPGRFAEAIETVLGRRPNGTGGIAHTGTGIVLAPQDMAPDEMLRRFARADPAAYAAASGGRHPRWSDGSAMSEAQFKQAQPVQVADGQYAFRSTNATASPGHFLSDDRGHTYIVDLRKLVAR